MGSNWSLATSFAFRWRSAFRRRAVCLPMPRRLQHAAAWVMTLVIGVTAGGVPLVSPGSGCGTGGCRCGDDCRCSLLSIVAGRCCCSTKSTGVMSTSAPTTANAQMTGSAKDARTPRPLPPCCAARQRRAAESRVSAVKSAAESGSCCAGRRTVSSPGGGGCSSMGTADGSNGVSQKRSRSSAAVPAGDLPRGTGVCNCGSSPLKLLIVGAEPRIGGASALQIPQPRRGASQRPPSESAEFSIAAPEVPPPRNVAA